MLQVYSLITGLKTYHSTLHPTPWSLDLLIRVPFQLPREHTVLQQFRRIEVNVHIAISVLPATHFHLSQVRHLRVKCSAQLTQHLNNVQRLRGEKHDISLKILHQAGFETAQQAATSAEGHAPTIAPCPSLTDAFSFNPYAAELFVSICHSFQAGNADANYSLKIMTKSMSI